MRKKKIDHRLCRVCEYPLGKVRDAQGHKDDGYCSGKCRKQDEGYSESYTRAKERAIQEMEGVTAWKPPPLDPILKVSSTKPITIMSDLHLPLASENWIKHSIECAKALDSEVLILNGDVMDLNQISRHMGSYYRRKQELGDDFDACEYFLKLICPAFRKVYWLSGNHCIERLIKLFRGEVGASRLLQMVGSYDNLKITSRSYLDVNKNVRICHPRQYSRNRSVLAQKLAQRWQMHIVTGHQHHAAKAVSPDGKWQAVDVPAMCQPDIQDYVRNELNDYPEPLQGFGVVSGEYIEVFTKFTNWDLFGLPKPKKPLE